MRRLATLILLSGLPTMLGCKSAYVEATVHNGTGTAVTLLEVDYPSASFGKEQLLAGADFRYRFKILGSGPTKVTWTDAARKEHTVAGPELMEGQQGTLSIQLNEDTALWQAHLNPSH